MYVSSYSTFINTSSSDRVQREREEPKREGKSSFASNLVKPSTKLLGNSASLPINYVSNYKVLNNQQKLQQDTQQNMEKMKFSKIKAFDSAKNPYTDNTKLFSLLIKPSATLDQTPKIDKKMPQNAQEAKEKFLRNEMINAYVSNDSYYRITAA